MEQILLSLLECVTHSVLAFGDVYMQERRALVLSSAKVIFLVAGILEILTILSVDLLDLRTSLLSYTLASRACFGPNWVYQYMCIFISMCDYIHRDSEWSIVDKDVQESPRDK